MYKFPSKKQLPKMTEEQAIYLLEQLTWKDPESDHATADAILLAFLRHNGFEKLHRKFKELTKHA